jgi:5-methylcytosine-specific restriction endonuclease McrA
MKRRADIDTSELAASYQSGLGLKRLSKLFGMSKVGIQKRLIAAGVYVPERGCKTKDRGKCKNCDTALHKGQQQFCSLSCRAKVMNRGINRHGVPGRNMPKPCLWCGAEHRNRFYCSQACAHEASKKPLTEERIKKRRLKTLLAVRRYQAKRLQQTPADADPEKIATFYANCPVGHEVDHKIPISRGGQHHQNNLQYLPKLDNRRKSNKLDWVPSDA